MLSHLPLAPARLCGPVPAVARENEYPSVLQWSAIYSSLWSYHCHVPFELVPPPSPPPLTYRVPPPQVKGQVPYGAGNTL